MHILQHYDHCCLPKFRFLKEANAKHFSCAITNTVMSNASLAPPGQSLQQAPLNNTPAIYWESTEAQILFATTKKKVLLSQLTSK